MGNLSGIFQGHTDTDPSPEGLIQLDLLGLRFRNTHIDRIYSSNIGRAVKTAQAINKYHGVPHEQWAEFCEICVGKMDGMVWGDIPKAYPDQADKWNNTPCDFVSDAGESMRDVYSRVSEGFEKAVAENLGKTIVIVSHGCALRNLICYCMNKPIEELNDLDFGSNTAVSLVEVEDGKREVIFFNNTGHLPDEEKGKTHAASFMLK